MLFEPATKQLALLANRSLSARELLEAHFARIDRINPSLNAVIWQDRERALAEASAVDSPPDVARPLLGLPVTVKEAFDVVGAATTWGDPNFRNNIAASDAVVVQRLRAAGAIVFGKTNVPFMLSDVQSYNDIYGATNNPWNAARVPGGSSGGSAAALAAGLAALEFGSDIGGSVRVPAHFCGIFGHKPTWGLIPVRGHSLTGTRAEPDIAVVGPMARSAYDLELLLDLQALPDSHSRGIRYELRGLEGRKLGDLRVAIWRDDAVSPVSADIRAGVDRIARALRDEGAEVTDDARPAFTSAHAYEVYWELLWSFLAGGMPRPVYEDMAAQAAALPATATNSQDSTMRASTIDHHRWLALHEQREHLRWAWHEFFHDYDIVIAPPSPTTAIRHDHTPSQSDRTIDVDGVPRPYLDQLFWGGLIGVAHLPSTVIPTGLADDGLPVGVQIIGRGYADRMLIQIAQRLEDLGFAFSRPPRID